MCFVSVSALRLLYLFVQLDSVNTCGCVSCNYFHFSPPFWYSWEISIPLIYIFLMGTSLIMTRENPPPSLPAMLLSHRAQYGPFERGAFILSPLLLRHRDQMSGEERGTRHASELMPIDSSHPQENFLIFRTFFLSFPSSF